MTAALTLNNGQATATTVLRGTGTRFDLVDATPRGLPPYTPTDPSPARVGQPED